MGNIVPNITSPLPTIIYEEKYIICATTPIYIYIMVPKGHPWSKIYVNTNPTLINNFYFSQIKVDYLENCPDELQYKHKTGYWIRFSYENVQDNSLYDNLGLPITCYENTIKDHSNLLVNDAKNIMKKLE